jgi:hypothetical protein
MLYCIFCYKDDEPLLALCAERLQQVDPAARIYAISDAASPLKSAPPGVELRESRFPRGGTLNGLPCVAGMLAVYRELMAAEGVDYIVKLDVTLIEQTHVCAKSGCSDISNLHIANIGRQSFYRKCSLKASV